MTPSFVTAFAPDPDALLRQLAPRIDDIMLREIAACDYGYDVDRRFALLTGARDALVVDVADFGLREVLDLTKWSEPDVPEMRGGAKGKRGHWMRAFACAALLRGYGAPGGADHAFGTNDALIQLVASLDSLDAGLEPHAASAVAWSVGALGETCPDEMAFFGVALLWFALRTGARDEMIAAVCAWTEREAQRAAAHAAERGRTSERWLVGVAAYGQRNGGWQDLGRKLLALDTRGRAKDVQDWVALIGAALAGDA